MWGNVTAVIRFSIVEPTVPFLVSKFVFKRLGGVLDLDQNELLLRRLHSASEPLYDLVAGHVGVELVKPGVNPPVCSQETIKLCIEGDEVTVDNPELRKQLANYVTPEHGTHMVALPEASTVTFADDNEREETTYDLSDTEDEAVNDFLVELTNSRKKKPLHTRTRAAPFYDELAPGWRARARDLAPPFANVRGHPSPSVLSEAMVDSDPPSLGSGDEPPSGRSSGHGDRTPRPRQGRQKEVHLDDEQSRAGRGSSSEPGNDGDASREGNSSNTTRKAQKLQERLSDDRGSSGEASEGSGQDASQRAQRGSSPSQPSEPRTLHQGKVDRVDPRRRRKSSNARAEFFTLDNGSASEYETPGRRLGDATGRAGDAQEALKHSLFQWAANVVTGVAGRSRALVNRVLHTSEPSELIAPESEFKIAVEGRESWTQVTSSAKQFDDSVLSGLNDPVWRQTMLVSTGEVIESRAFTATHPLPETDIPSGPQNIKTTVWYGRVAAPTRPKVRKNLLKGIQTATAVFLLEAMVLLSASAQWSGSWTQRHYGSGQADVWEVFGDHGMLTKVSWRQGWRPLEPLLESKFGQSSFCEYVTDTLNEREPRLVVMECPRKHWNLCFTQQTPGANNSARQRDKKIRAALNPFLTMSCDIANKQCESGHDFLLETPLTPQVMKHPIIEKMTNDERFHVVNGLDLRCQRPTWWLTSAHKIAQGLDKDVCKRPTKMIKNVMTNFGVHLTHQEPERIKSLLRAIDARIRGAGLAAETFMVDLSRDLKEHVNYRIIREKGDIPEAGIEFDVPPELHAKMPKSLLSAVRRLHFNSGHPPNDELERIVRLSGGSDLARAAVKGIKCTICRKHAPPKSAKPGKVKSYIGQFNDTVLVDLAYEKDSKGVTHAYAVMVDAGTDWTVVKYIGSTGGGKTAAELYKLVEEGWIDFAGPPDTLVADGERGFVSELFTDKLGKAGTLFRPAAAYAPWQKGQVERKIQSMCSIIRKTTLHLGLDGDIDMKLAGIEAATALNQRPGASGVSPSMMLFGQRMKLFGELYQDGEPAYHHLDGNDATTELGRRLQIRCSARQATEAHYAKELVRKTVAARTRHVERVDVGELVFFYRKYPSTKSVKMQAQRGCYLGPGVVIGHQKANTWISYAGRCYLVAPEHLRSLAPDEIASAKPVLRYGLEELRKASNAKDYIDITSQEVTPDDLSVAVQQPAGNDHSADGSKDKDLQEDVSLETAAAADPAGLDVAVPAVELQPAPEEMEVDNQEVETLHQVVTEHVEEPGDTTMDSESAPEKRKHDSDSNAEPASGPVSWKPTGPENSLKWKKQRGDTTFNTSGKRILSAKIKKKMLDKEIPYREIPPKDLDLYHKAEEKEWQDWIKNKSVKIIKGQEAKTLSRTFDPDRLINLRFVYRDKNASVRTPQTWLPVKAKARLCAQGSKEPLAKAGMVKLDSPTVQRIGIMIFLQLTANFGWYDTWRKGDISSAFLQGTERDVDAKGRLFLRPPRDRPLDGVDEGDLLEVLKSVYGLPDAPRSWWEQVTGTLRSLGFQHSRLDVAYMILYNDTGSIAAMLILHVDDIMVATDGSSFAEAKVEAFHKTYPFGEWEYVSKIKEIAYTGRQISLHGTEIHIGQKDFIEGRMDDVPCKREKNRKPEDPCTPIEHAEFRSGVGNLHWATSQSRVDHAVDTSRSQKRQNAPKYEDLKDLVKVVREVKDTSDVVIKIRPVKNMVIAAYTDSSLYGSEGELIDNDEDLSGYDKHKLHSQGGSLIVIMNKNHLDDLNDVPFSFADWRTRASRRVLHSTFGAEAQSAVETIGLAKYYRAYMADVLLGYAEWRPLESYGETEIPIVLFTDCKSLFDHLKKEGSVPDDKWVAVPIGSLRGAVSAGPGRNEAKADCRWVPSRWQLADCLTKKGLAAGFRERISSGTTRLHELSLQEVKRKKKPKPHGTNLCYCDTQDQLPVTPWPQIASAHQVYFNLIDTMPELACAENMNTEPLSARDSFIPSGLSPELSKDSQSQAGVLGMVFGQLEVKQEPIAGSGRHARYDPRTSDVMADILTMGDNEECETYFRLEGIKSLRVHRSGAVCNK